MITESAVDGNMKRKGIVLKNWLSLRSLILCSILLVLAISMTIMSNSFYRFYINDKTEHIQNEMTSYIDNSVQLIGKRMSTIQNRANSFSADKRLYQILAPLTVQEYPTKLTIWNTEREISDLLTEYFGEFDMFSVDLVTEWFVFNDVIGKTVGVSTRQYLQSEIFKNAHRTDGNPIWLINYSYADMFNESSYARTKNAYRNLYGIARLISRDYLIKHKSYHLDRGELQPVLVLAENTSTFDSYFGSDTPFQHATILIADSDSNFVYSNKGVDDITYMEECAHKLIELKEDYGSIEGPDVIYYRKKLFENDWYVYMMVDKDTVGSEINAVIRSVLIRNIVITAAVALILALVLGFYITKPIHGLMEGFNRIGRGEMGTFVEEDTYIEFSKLMKGYNDMALRLQKLIHENYEVRLSKQEFEMAALSQQMNPHFLYNTLGIINWMIDEGSYDRAREMIVMLGKMLHYTAQNTEAITELRWDIEWMKSYIQIAAVRYERNYDIRFEIPEALLECQVPKLFLQPFVENSVLHGFKGKKEGCVLIKAERNGEQLQFDIIDDGNGIPVETINALNKAFQMESDFKESGSIGLYNTNRRITLLYGDAASVRILSADSGAHIRIIMPATV